MMTVEVTEVPPCRVGLALTLPDGPPGCQAAMGVTVNASIQSCQKMVRIPRIPANSATAVSSCARTFDRLNPTTSPTSLL